MVFIVFLSYGCLCIDMCIVLWIVLCIVMLCYVTLRYVLLCNVLVWYGVVWNAMLCCFVLCHLEAIVGVKEPPNYRHAPCAQRSHGDRKKKNEEEEEEIHPKRFEC